MGTEKQKAFLYICEQATRGRERGGTFTKDGPMRNKERHAAKNETIDETNTHLPEVVERELCQLLKAELLIGDDRRECVPVGQLLLEFVEHALELVDVVGGHRRAVRRGAAEPKGGRGAAPDPLQPLVPARVQTVQPLRWRLPMHLAFRRRLILKF